MTASKKLSVRVSIVVLKNTYQSEETCSLLGRLVVLFSGLFDFFPMISLSRIYIYLKSALLLEICWYLETLYV